MNQRIAFRRHGPNIISAMRIAGSMGLLRHPAAAAPVDSLVALDLGWNHHRYQDCQSGICLGCLQTVLLPSYHSQQTDWLPAFPGRAGHFLDRDSRRRRVRYCDLCGHSGGASAR